MARKTLGKKARFEVFKRDDFQCQYCGSKAPEVVLQVDHIKPVAKGGGNGITNLVTACQGCNSGKGARELSDSTAVEKQRVQMETLNERRLQLEMMMEWREGLGALEDSMMEGVSECLIPFDFEMNAQGRGLMKKWIKKYGLEDVLDALDTSFDQYLEFNEDGTSTFESREKAFRYIPRIIGVRLRSKDSPKLQDLYYIRGILRNRLQGVNEPECLRLLELCVEVGASVDSLRKLSKAVLRWSDFRNEAEAFIAQHKDAASAQADSA